RIKLAVHARRGTLVNGFRDLDPSSSLLACPLIPLSVVVSVLALLVPPPLLQQQQPHLPLWDRPSNHSNPVPAPPCNTHLHTPLVFLCAGFLAASGQDYLYLVFPTTPTIIVPSIFLLAILP
ncbi:hypothetical protein NW757_008563, partial [Fusarium falciforme]